MNSRDYKLSAWVQVVRSLEGFDACVPRNLPPPLEYGASMLGALSAADRALGQLAGIARTLPNPRLLIRSFVNREAVLSSKIEGTKTTLEDLFLFEISPELEQRTPDVREVYNYVCALDHGVDRLRHIPLSLNLIRDLHRILLDGVRGSDRRPGEFRNCQNFIGNSRDIRDAIYVPPPPEKLRPALDAFERFVNRPNELPLLIRLAMIHYQFEAIHPFEDGNGRVGRLLISLVLECERALPYPVLYLSAYLERHRSQYYEHLKLVGQRGEWSTWIEFFLRGVADQSIDAVERAQSLITLRNQWADACQTARTSALLLKLVDELFRNPFVNLASVRRLLDVQAQSAQNNIDQLIHRGILTEITGQKRNRIYAGRQVLRILEQTPAFDPVPRE